MWNAELRAIWAHAHGHRVDARIDDASDTIVNLYHGSDPADTRRSHHHEPRPATG